VVDAGKVLQHSRKLTVVSTQQVRAHERRRLRAAPRDLDETPADLPETGSGAKCHDKQPNVIRIRAKLLEQAGIAHFRSQSVGRIEHSASARREDALFDRAIGHDVVFPG